MVGPLQAPSSPTAPADTIPDLWGLKRTETFQHSRRGGVPEHLSELQVQRLGYVPLEPNVLTGARGRVAMQVSGEAIAPAGRQLGAPPPPLRAPSVEQTAQP